VFLSLRWDVEAKKQEREGKREKKEEKNRERIEVGRRKRKIEFSFPK